MYKFLTNFDYIDFFLRIFYYNQPNMKKLFYLIIFFFPNYFRESKHNLSIQK